MRPLNRLSTTLLIGGLILLVALPRLTALNDYIIVDEADRWRWAEDFVYALSQGDLAATLVGDGYPGIVPIWAASIWILLEAGRRSFSEGQWIGEAGLYNLFHEWERTEFLFQQRLPIVLLNTLVALGIIWAVWRLFGPRVALVSGLLIALDPFYLSDSRVNRAEAVITGLMTLSLLFLIFYDQKRHFGYIILSGICGGLSLLTKIQALAIAPAIVLTGFLIYTEAGTRNGQEAGSRKQEVGTRNGQNNSPARFASLLPTAYSLLPTLKFGLAWLLAAGLTWLLLWPAMWVTPLETLSLVYNYTTRKVGAEGISLFFLGQTYQDADPGLLFYPVVFFLRITPLALLGLIGLIWASLQQKSQRLCEAPLQNARRGLSIPRPTLVDLAIHQEQNIRGSAILIIYTILYTLVMTLGSHKQDRYLLPIFLSVDILAGLGLVYLWMWLKSKLNLTLTAFFNSRYSEWAVFGLLVIFQIGLILPHHPYYYSYFNPLFGGGRTAVGALRIGWGEGMDQVGRYLAAKPNSRDLVVSTRFTHNLIDFKGEVLALGADGRWTQADYIVLYIQQVQRHLDPSPGFIDYFQARQPEKVIRLGDIDYAWIYPIPFSVAADPEISQMPGQVALLGYRWEATNGEAGHNQPLIRLFWQNLGLTGEHNLVARLVGATDETEWAACRLEAKFAERFRPQRFWKPLRSKPTRGAYLESLCAPTTAALPPGPYSVEVGLAAANETTTPFDFPEGWHAAQVMAEGSIRDSEPLERLDAIVAEVAPLEAERLDRIYEGRLRLAAYQVTPTTPTPGDTLELTLYWQPLKEMSKRVTLTIQLADSRHISLGRTAGVLYDPAIETTSPSWQPGKVIITHHTLELSSDLAGPLAAQVELTLTDAAEVVQRATTLTQEPLDSVLHRFTIAPQVWPSPTEATPVTATWQNGIRLQNYQILADAIQPGETIPIRLLWETQRPLVENYVVFIHFLDSTRQLISQNDSLPRAGAYPTQWWLPGQVIEDTHPLNLPADLSPGVYQLVVGLYRAEDGVRLSLTDGGDRVELGEIRVR